MRLVALALAPGKVGAGAVLGRDRAHSQRANVVAARQRRSLDDFAPGEHRVAREQRVDLRKEHLFSDYKSFDGLMLPTKLIVRAKNRDEAVARMMRALEMFIVEGVYTTIPLHRKIFADPDFRAGNFDTGFIERFLAKAK